MTDKERYERAMRQDFPRDFVDDDYLDALEEVLCGKSCLTTNTACRMPKSGGDKKMSKKYGTDKQQAAFNAGYGYGHGKANKRVQVQPENQAAFRDGVNVARSKFGKPKIPKESQPERTVQDKIKYYSSRIDDPNLSARQRAWAVMRLQQLAKSK